MSSNFSTERVHYLHETTGAEHRTFPTRSNKTRTLKAGAIALVAVLSLGLTVTSAAAEIASPSTPVASSAANSQSTSLYPGVPGE